ncbi:MAG: hypothetical protein RJA52_367, partial [Bacteroidota bacterium]
MINIVKPIYTNNMKKPLYILFFIPFIGLSQTPGQIQELLNLSQFLSERAVSRKQEALNRARGLRMAERRELGDGKVIELMAFEGEFPVFYATSNTTAANSIRTNEIQSGGSSGLSLTGVTDTLGIWDEGITRTTHQEFGSRVILGDGTTTISNHGTHVGGTMIASGTVSSAKGMSPSA